MTPRRYGPLAYVRITRPRNVMRRRLGRPADTTKRFPNFAWGYGMTR